jgi:hypothetical protein
MDGFVHGLMGVIALGLTDGFALGLLGVIALGLMDGFALMDGPGFGAVGGSAFANLGHWQFFCKCHPVLK